MNNAKILVIDDEPQIQKLLQINLESNQYKVIEAYSGKEGILLAASHQPDLILLDLGLPDISGHHTLIDLRTWFTKPIIILSVQNAEEDIVKALDNGATDYLTKPFRTGELLARIRVAIRDNQSENKNSTILIGSLRIELTARLVYKNDALVKLTTTEYNLLVLLARNENKILTHNYLLREVWGKQYENETQYLRVFVASLRKKIEVNPNLPQHIITESGIGYRFQ